MKTPEKVLDIFKKYSPIINSELKEILKRDCTPHMYGMMSYFMGFTDKDFKPVEGYGGKRFRSSLCLLIADMYDKLDSAVAPATSLELYHNFTLIHDDIVDKDELRRGRPTVWKLWGVDHAINTGDAQLILANKALLNASPDDINIRQRLFECLNECYLTVIEGQHIDFNVGNMRVDDTDISEELYFNLISKKTAYLIGASTKSAGIAAGLDSESIEALWEYGYNLGLAYQLNDDLVSIWGDSEVTGKTPYNDIQEKKKTLPVLYAYAQLMDDEKKHFSELYDVEGSLSEESIKEVVLILEDTFAYEYVWKKVEQYAEKSKEAVSSLKLNKSNKDILHSIVDALLPEMKKA